MCRIVTSTFLHDEGDWQLSDPRFDAKLLTFGMFGFNLRSRRYWNHFSVFYIGLEDRPRFQSFIQLGHASVFILRSCTEWNRVHIIIFLVTEGEHKMVNVSCWLFWSFCASIWLVSILRARTSNMEWQDYRPHNSYEKCHYIITTCTCDYRL